MTLPSGYRFPDLSRYRTVCNWPGFLGAYPVAACKATEGNSRTDPSFGPWWQQMRANHAYPIAYCFLRGEYPVWEQVQYFLNVVGKDRTIGVMLDVETSGVGSNPSVAQADEWFDRMSAARGQPRHSMLCYMPRWWWQAHGGGSTVLRDTICYNSNYSSSPYLGAYAGWDKVDVIQFSSSWPIAGLCSPGTGDGNVAIGITPAQFILLLSGGSSVQTSPIPEEDMPYEITDGRRVRLVSGGTIIGYESNTHRTELLNSFAKVGIEVKSVPVNEYWFDRISAAGALASSDGRNLLEGARLELLVAAGVNAAAGGQLGPRLDEILDVVHGIPGGSTSTSLTDADLERIRAAVDAELDKRNLSLAD